MGCWSGKRTSRAFEQTQIIHGRFVERREGDFLLRPSPERHQLRREWNDTAAPAGGLFLELFAHRVARTPEAVALVWEEARLSYGELDRRTDQLARTLRARGVGAGSEVPVGIFVERSPEMVAAILGILKAGGAWLPLDPEYPREPLAFMAADTRLEWVLTQERQPLPYKVPDVSQFRAGRDHRRAPGPAPEPGNGRCPGRPGRRRRRRGEGPRGRCAGTATLRGRGPRRR